MTDERIDKKALTKLQRMTWEQRNKKVMYYRGIDRKWSNRLYFFSDEGLVHALKRKVLDFKESGVILVYSLRQPTGSGKSNSTLYTALQLSKACGNQFDLDKDLVFTGADFLARMEKLDSTHEGQVLIWDEGAIGGGGSRLWRQRLNQDIAECVRMSRFFLPFVFIIVPLVDFIDIAVRRITNIELECFLADQYKKVSYGEFRTLERDLSPEGKTSDIRQAPIRIHEEVGDRYFSADGEHEDIIQKFEFITSTSFPFVDEEHWKIYEERKKNAYYDIVKEREGSRKENDTEQMLQEELRRKNIENIRLKQKLGGYEKGKNLKKKKAGK